MKYPVVVVSLTGGVCGGGNESGADITIRNDTGFPAVSGLHTFYSSDLIETCGGGQPKNFGRLAQNVRISQSCNGLTLCPIDDRVLPGFTVTSQTSMSGTIGLNGTFVANRSVSALTTVAVRRVFIGGR